VQRHFTGEHDVRGERGHIGRQAPEMKMMLGVYAGLGALIHLRNLVQATEAGAIVIPAAPGFYHRPARVADLVDFIVQRVLDQLGVDLAIAPRWAGQDS